MAVLCVLVLGILAVSPDWHAGLHERHAVAHQAAPVGSGDHVCAVTLFASGVTALLVFCLLALGLLPAAGFAWRAMDFIAAAQPRYRLVPSHAPPAA